MAAPKQTDPQFKLRLTPDLKADIESAAVQNNRSMNAEILDRLQRSFDVGEDVEALAKRVIEAEAARNTLFAVHQFVVGIIASAAGNDREVTQLIADAIRKLSLGGEEGGKARIEARERAVEQLAKSLTLANEHGLDKLGLGVVPDDKKK